MNYAYVYSSLTSSLTFEVNRMTSPASKRSNSHALFEPNLPTTAPHIDKEISAKVALVATDLFQKATTEDSSAPTKKIDAEQQIEPLGDSLYIPQHSNFITERRFFIQLSEGKNQSHIAVAKIVGFSVFAQFSDHLKVSISNLLLNVKDAPLFIPDGSNFEIEHSIFAKIIAEGNCTNILVAKIIGPSTFTQLPELTFSDWNAITPDNMSHSIMRYPKGVVCRYVIRTECSSKRRCSAIFHEGPWRGNFMSSRKLLNSNLPMVDQIDFITRLFSHKACGEVRLFEGRRTLVDGRSVVEIE